MGSVFKTVAVATGIIIIFMSIIAGLQDDSEYKGFEKVLHYWEIGKYGDEPAPEKTKKETSKRSKSSDKKDVDEKKEVAKKDSTKTGTKKIVGAVHRDKWPKDRVDWLKMKKKLLADKGKPSDKKDADKKKAKGSTLSPEERRKSLDTRGFLPSISPTEKRRQIGS
jgi:hypothetical protein